MLKQLYITMDNCWMLMTFPNDYCFFKHRCVVGVERKKKDFWWRNVSIFKNNIFKSPTSISNDRELLRFIYLFIHIYPNYIIMYGISKKYIFFLLLFVVVLSSSSSHFALLMCNGNKYKNHRLDFDCLWSQTKAISENWQ